MKFCDDHWQMLNKAIEERGLSEWVAPDEETTVRQIANQLEVDQYTPTNYDPLVASVISIAANTMHMMADNGNNPMYLLMVGPKDPVEGYEGFEGRTWPRCPICYVNLAHEVSCKGGDCELDRERAYDFFIERAADDQIEIARKLSEQPT